MANSNLASLELAKSALSLLQEASDSEDELLALSLVTSAVALHLLKKPSRVKRTRFVAAEQDYHSRRSSSEENVESTSPCFEIRDEAANNISTEEKIEECTSSGAPTNDFKIEYFPVELMTVGQSQAAAIDEPSDQSNEDRSSSGSKRKRQWSKFEDERRRVLLRLKSDDSLDMMCAEPKITDYMSIFLDSLKMNITTFNLLLSLIRKDIERQNTCMRMTVASEQRLAICLRFLSTGETYTVMEKSVKVSRAFLCINMPLLCKALWKNLKVQYLKLPSCEGEWASKAEEFDSRWQFPLCLGTLTRRHFKFKSPRSASVLALVDANSKFIHVDIEKEEDICVNHENVPPPQSIGNNRLLPYVFIAQDGFELDEHIMTPFIHTDTSSRRVFNSRLKASSRVADQTFRILVERFKILLSPMNLLQHHVDDVIRACCVLHNFLMENNPDLYAPGLNDEESFDGPDVISLAESTQYNESAEATREEFAEYFTKEGSVPTFDVKLFEDEGTSASNVLLDMLSI